MPDEKLSDMTTHNVPDATTRIYTVKGTTHGYSEVQDLSGVIGADEKVKVSSNDTTAGYLNGKLAAGSNITLVEELDGADEILTINAIGGGLSDELVKVSSNDDSAAYLETKIGASTGISLNVSDEGGDEVLVISCTVTDTHDEKVLVSNLDTTPDYLNGKLGAGTGISLTQVDGPGDETLVIACTITDTHDEKVMVSADDTTPDYLEGKLAAGTSISLVASGGPGDETLTINYTGVGTDEKVSVSANDTTPGYLNGKLVAGSGIDLTENNDGGDETFTVDLRGTSPQAICVTYIGLAAADDDGILTIRTFHDETVAEGSFDGQLDYPRPVGIYVQGGIVAANGDVTIHGIDANGDVIQETENFSAVLLGGTTKFTSLAFARVTSVVVSNFSGDAASLYKIGWKDSFGFHNYPFGNNADIYKVVITTLPTSTDYAVSNFTVDKTYGTLDIGVFTAIGSGDTLTVWFRPWMVHP